MGLIRKLIAFGRVRPTKTKLDKPRKIAKSPKVDALHIVADPETGQILSVTQIPATPVKRRKKRPISQLVPGVPIRRAIRSEERN